MADSGPPGGPCCMTSGTSCPTCTTAYTSCPTDSSSKTTDSTCSYVPIKLVTFKPEFTGKPDKDEEEHLLRTNDWMDTHAISEGVKAQ